MATAHEVAVVLGACGIAVLMLLLIIAWVSWFRALRRAIPEIKDDLSLWFHVQFWFWSHLVVYSRHFPALHQFSMKRTGTLIAPLPTGLQDTLLEGDWTEFDKFLNEHLQIKSDCVNRKDDLDCLERNLPEAEWCHVCREYDRVLKLWDAKTGE